MVGYDDAEGYCEEIAEIPSRIRVATGWVGHRVVPLAMGDGISWQSPADCANTPPIERLRRCRMQPLCVRFGSSGAGRRSCGAGGTRAVRHIGFRLLLRVRSRRESFRPNGQYCGSQTLARKPVTPPRTTRSICESSILAQSGNRIRRDEKSMLLTQGVGVRPNL